jgi:hypothetical protein
LIWLDDRLDRGLISLISLSSLACFSLGDAPPGGRIIGKEKKEKKERRKI